MHTDRRLELFEIQALVTTVVRQSYPGQQLVKHMDSVAGWIGVVNSRHLDKLKKSGMLFT